MTRTSRILLVVLLASFACVGVARTQTESANPKLSIAIRTEKPQVPMGSTIEIEVKITNISTEPITLAFGNRGNVACCYQYDVRDEQGTPAVKAGARSLQLPNGQTLKYPSRPPGSITSGELAPGKSITGGSTISDDYRFDHPGRYTIQVSRYVSDKVDETDKVYSNIVTITVLPGGTAPTEK